MREAGLRFGDGAANFHGEKRSNETHESTTDPEAKLARKGSGKESKLSYSGHVLMENRNGLCVDVRVAPATGYAERDEALEMLRRLRRRGYTPKTVAGDKGSVPARRLHRGACDTTVPFLKGRNESTIRAYSRAGLDDFVVRAGGRSSRRGVGGRSGKPATQLARRAPDRRGRAEKNRWKGRPGHRHQTSCRSRCPRGSDRRVHRQTCARSACRDATPGRGALPPIFRGRE